MVHVGASWMACAHTWVTYECTWMVQEGVHKEVVIRCSFLEIYNEVSLQGLELGLEIRV